MKLKELAAQLGLSITTVSRALNGYADVAPVTRERVLAAANRSGYAPNVSAQRLITGRVQVIGFVLPLPAGRFADPFLWVPEVARVLRPSGLLAFSGGTPFEAICFDDPSDTWDARLHRPYFGLHQVSFGDDGAVEFELPYGEWIRLFRRSGFAVEALVEVRPPEGAESTYRNAEETAWAQRWPMEQIWKVRREAA